MVRPFTRSTLRRLQAGWNTGLSSDFLYCPLLSAALAAGEEKAFALIAREAHVAGVSRRRLIEIVLQSHLFLGYPAMIEGMRLLADIPGSRPGRNSVPTSYSPQQCQKWHREGMIKIRRLYGQQFDRLVQYINSFSPQVLTWMVNDGYGRVLSRSGASFELRELSTVAALTVTGYANQLGAHVRGTLNLGVAPELVADTIANCRSFCSAERTDRAIKILQWAMTA